MTQLTYEFDENTNPLAIVVTDLTTPDDGSAWKDTSSLGEKVTEKVIDLTEQATANAFSAIFHMARYTSQLIRRLRESDKDVPLETVQMQFGLKLTGSGKIILVDASAEANLSITLSWKEK